MPGLVPRWPARAIPEKADIAHYRVSEQAIYAGSLLQTRGRTAMSTRTPDAEALLTPAEVATISGGDQKPVPRGAKSGNPPSTGTRGAHRRYREAEVRALLAGIPQPRPANS